jgi:release factor glutamine methyltransferase
LSQGAGARLLPGGRLLLEIGHRQAAAVSALLAGQGFVQIRVHTDLNGHDRVVSAEKPVDSRG